MAEVVEIYFGVREEVVQQNVVKFKSLRLENRHGESQTELFWKTVSGLS